MEDTKALPNLDTAIEKLSEIADVTIIDVDAPLIDLEIDSLDVFEWLVAIGIELEDAEDLGDLFVDIDTLTLRSLYDELRTKLG